MNSKGIQPYIHMYPFSPKLPFPLACHNTEQSSIYHTSRSLLVIHFKYSSVYMSIHPKLSNYPFPSSFSLAVISSFSKSVNLCFFKYVNLYQFFFDSTYVMSYDISPSLTYFTQYDYLYWPVIWQRIYFLLASNQSHLGELLAKVICMTDYIIDST